MKSSAKRISLSLLSLLVVVAVCFVVASIWLVSNVNQNRTKIENLVGQVGLVSALEVQLTECLEHGSNGNQAAFERTAKSVVQTDFFLTDYPELSEIAEKTATLQTFFNESGALTEFDVFQDQLQNLYALSVSEVKNKRGELAIISTELGDYWEYTHTLILLAAILVFILVIFAFVIFRSRQKFKNLQSQNVSFMNNVIDCVILCDKAGNITAFNKVAEKTFGYTRKEAVGMSVVKLYAHASAWENVHRVLNSLAHYQGEIINVKKNGEQFVSFLSANVMIDASGNESGTMGISRDITDQKREQEQFQHIVNNATDIIYTTNIEGEVTYVNTSAKSILGYKNQDVIGISFRELIHPDSLEEVDQFYRNQFLNGTSESYLEFQLLKSNGEPIWVGQNVKTTFSPVNPTQAIGFFGILRNLDEIKKIEFNLKESEGKYRELFDNSKDLIQSIDANGGLLYVNDAWKKTLGYSDEEVKKLNLYDILHKDSRDYCEQLLSEILKLGAHDEKGEHIFRMLSKTGQQIILKGSLSIKFEGGQVESLQTFLRDITEQFETEEALKRSEANFRQISRSINDVFFLFDVVREKYDFISPNCGLVLGVEPDFFYKKGDYTETFVHEDDRTAVREMFKAVLKGELGHLEYRRIASDGKIVWIDEKWFPIKNEAGITTNISGICRDITDVKAAYDIIYNQNTEINQSIDYAKNIQESTLPTKEEFEEIWPNSFVFYKAKDVLSGDLYIVETVRDNNGLKMPAFVVGDCTGHGVPGGLLSLLCSGLLRESLTHPDINSPAAALDFVREKLIRLFRSKKSSYILDGMDAAFCVFNPRKMELYFSGANLSCFLVRRDEVIEYKGDKQHIGYSSKMAPFVPFNIDVEEGDTIYLTTDGYIDQFGGAKNKKFLRKRFTELLLEIQNNSMAEQQEKIQERFESWKADNFQTDDVVVMGIRI